jgi:hypothetical protein
MATKPVTIRSRYDSNNTESLVPSDCPLEAQLLNGWYVVPAKHLFGWRVKEFDELFDEGAIDFWEQVKT